jgi:hypothetical protein
VLYFGLHHICETRLEVVPTLECGTYRLLVPALCEMQVRRSLLLSSERYQVRRGFDSQLEGVDGDGLPVAGHPRGFSRPCHSTAFCTPITSTATTEQSKRPSCDSLSMSYGPL